MRTVLLISILLLGGFHVSAQPAKNRQICITILSPDNEGLSHASVSLLREDSTIINTMISDTMGRVIFWVLDPGKYMCLISRVDHQPYHTGIIDLVNKTFFSETVVLRPLAGLLRDVTVASKKPFIQFLPDRTVVNVEAGITNEGATIMEVLEKSPGIIVDKEGNISLKGKPGVQVMIDGKLTQLGGSDLQNLLSGMSASQVESIELIDNPSAKYDAAGNGGLINIRTKKNKQKGFNGSLNLSYGQGRYPRNNNSLVFNYRTGAFNFFLSYGLNLARYFTDLYALRTYYKDDGSVATLLEQPYYTRGKGYTHSIRTGVDYYLSARTTLGLALNGISLSRKNEGNSTAVWKDAQGNTDSTIYTNSLADTRILQGGVNLNGRHVFNATKELSADIDIIRYDMNNNQFFENHPRVRLYSSGIDATKGEIPSTLNIYSVKADYSQRFGKLLWETGGKSSRVTTDNLAQYYTGGAGNWWEDLGKSNHFLYTENIHALYTNFDTRAGKWSMQGGLRYEYTAYKAAQLGNAVAKDSSFNRNYYGFFPTAFLTYKADSSNSFTLRAGRRIDRPAFQKLNPFTYIINKYTYQRGNPFIRPQYTWNIELSHLFKETLSTTASYSLTRDYFSQVFLSDTATGTIIYTEGNVGRMRYFGLSTSIQVSPTSWWSLSGQATLAHKKIEGVLWQAYKASITQLSLSVNNQFKFVKGWAAELSGYYITRNQNDLQEVLDPTGQLSIGLSRQVLKTKGVLRLGLRDIFYTQAMAGLTHFQSVIEYFKLQRDTRVATLSFIYRFGKGTKPPAKRSTGGAVEEMDRAGGN